MDVIQHVLNLVFFGVATFGIGATALVVTYPEQTFWLFTTICLLWLSRKNKRLRRIQNWYLLFPVQRFLHRLYVPYRKRMRGFLMCKVKKSVIADILDDALFDALHRNQISRHDYRELCLKIGKALDLADIIPKGPAYREQIQKQILKNCEAMRSTPKVEIPGGLPQPLVHEPAFKILRDRNAA